MSRGLAWSATPTTSRLGQGGLCVTRRGRMSLCRTVPIGRNMLLRDISARTSYDGATFKDLGAHVRKYPTYKGIRDPGD
eukprot:7251814-Pyramimonas_sp.AAC.1